MEMETIVVEDNGSEVIVVGRGELDLSNADDFGYALRNTSMTAENLTVDIRSATFIDTAILEYIARAATNMLGRGKRLKVIATKCSHPLYVLKTVGFSEFIDLVIVDDDTSDSE